MRRIHLDTDLGSDTDDLCALAMLLGWAGAELTGITTVSDSNGLRIGFIDHVLRLVGQSNIPVAAGADGSLSGFRDSVGFPFDSSDGRRYWPEPITPRPSPPGAALDLMARSIAAGARVVAIGPYTNLALLEAARPGLLASTQVVLMGGYVTSPRPGLPDWGPAGDYNVQQDSLAAQVVFERSDPLIVQLPVCLEVTLRATHLSQLRSLGPLGELLATQAELRGLDSHRAEPARQHEAVPTDLLNFQYDPLACAVAAGWDGVQVEEMRLVARLQDGVLAFAPDPAGKPTRVVTGVDAGRFEEEWLAAVTRAARSTMVG